MGGKLLSLTKDWSRQVVIGKSSRLEGYIMVRNNWIKMLLVTAVCSTAVGCKLIIAVPPGGYITDAAGTFTCEERQYCQIDVVDLFFDETFTAVANPGYTFHGWKKRERGLFGGNMNASVRIHTSSLDGHASLIQLLESDVEYYLEPDFAKDHHLVR